MTRRTTKIAAMLLAAALTLGVVGEPAAAAGNKPVPESAPSVSAKCVAGTAPAGNTPAGTCSSPFDAPPNLDQKCSFELVRIGLTLVTIPGFWRVAGTRWVRKITGHVNKLVGGLLTLVPIYNWVEENVLEWVEQRIVEVVEYAERRVCE